MNILELLNEPGDFVEGRIVSPRGLSMSRRASVAHIPGIMRNTVGSTYRID